MITARLESVMFQRHQEGQPHPLVSVCVPTYNYARFLPDCIESVQHQTFSDWELVITDDCSDDATRELVRRYAQSEPRIRYMVNERRLGMNANLQRAANSGRGRYLKILCADDWLGSRCLAVMFRLMEEHPNVVLATSAEIHTDQIGRPLRQQFLFGKPLSIISGSRMLERMARMQGFGGNSSFFIRRSAYQEVGGYDPAVLYMRVIGSWGGDCVASGTTCTPMTPCSTVGRILPAALLTTPRNSSMSWITSLFPNEPFGLESSRTVSGGAIAARTCV
jgi:hypothetical protein